MGDPASTTDLACPHCGASVMSDWKSCWLCGQDIPSGAAQPRQAVAAPVVGEPRGESAAMKWIGRGALGLVSFIVVCMLLGIVVEEGIEAAFFFMLVLAPALSITTTKVLNRRKSASPMSAFQIATNFVKYAIYTWLTAIALFVALIAALIVACLAGGPPNFH